MPDENNIPVKLWTGDDFVYTQVSQTVHLLSGTIKNIPLTIQTTAHQDGIETHSLFAYDNRKNPIISNATEDQIRDIISNIIELQQ